MIQEAIEKIKGMISSQSSLNMTKEQKYYVVGLSDALQVIEDLKEKQVAIGKDYYVIIKNKEKIPKYVIERMRLYRINFKDKYAYCFTRNTKQPTPDLILYSTIGLKKRVFNTYDGAKANIDYVDL